MTEMVTRRACCKTIALGAVAAPFAPALLAAAGKGEMGLKPMIKYRGGKAKEFGEYERFIPNDFDTYYEPFLGGGATFFRVMPRKAVIGDINEPLMNFYGDVRNRYDELMTELREIQGVYEANQKDYRVRKAATPEEKVPNANEQLYYELRDQFNGLKKRRYSRAALYFFINKTAYSGMIRYNSAGHYNVPFGRYEHLNAQLITRAHADLLASAELLTADYEVSFRRAGARDFMFLDPPYDCIFNDYGNQDAEKDGFAEKDHRRLAKLFRELKCRALMVIGHTPLTEELYGDLVKAEYAKSYAVNIRNRFKSQATHYVVTNYEV